MASQNLNVGTAANANDGDTLRAAFINVRKMFHEIYGITTTYADDLDLSTGGETFAESVQDIIGGMVSGNTENNITVTYDDASNKLNFTVAADITDVNAGYGLSGVNEAGGSATLSLDLNELTSATVDVAADSIPIIDSSDSNATRKESIADIVTGIAGSGLSATSGVIDVNDNLQIGGTESVGVPSGTTTQRNAISSPSAGMFRFNTTDSQFEGYDGSVWGEIGGSGDASTLYVDTFDGDGGTTFDLSQSISSENDTQVYIDGVYQSKSTYSTSGTTITFGEAPAAGTDNIEVIHIKAISLTTVADDSITHAKLENRYTASASITTLTGTVSFDCSTASVFKLSGDLTGAYTIDLTGYKKGQMISVYPLKGQTVTLDAQGTASNTFYKLAESDYDNTTTSLLQIECADDSATDPVFFYSVTTFASDSTI